MKAGHTCGQVLWSTLAARSSGAEPGGEQQAPSALTCRPRGHLRRWSGSLRRASCRRPQTGSPWTAPPSAGRGWWPRAGASHCEALTECLLLGLPLRHRRCLAAATYAAAGAARQVHQAAGRRLEQVEVSGVHHAVPHGAATAARDAAWVKDEAVELRLRPDNRARHAMRRGGIGLRTPRRGRSDHWFRIGNRSAAASH